MIVDVDDVEVGVVLASQGLEKRFVFVFLEYSVTGTVDAERQFVGDIADIEFLIIVIILLLLELFVGRIDGNFDTLLQFVFEIALFRTQNGLFETELIWGCRPVCYGQNRRIALQLFLIWE